MEEGIRAEKALARAHETQLPALQRSSDEGLSGHNGPAELLLRALPGSISSNEDRATQKVALAETILR